MITPPRRMEVLQWIRDYVEVNEWSPTIREVGQAFGWASTSTTHFHLLRLERDGYVIRGDGPRQLRLTDAGKNKTKKKKGKK